MSLCTVFLQLMFGLNKKKKKCLYIALHIVVHTAKRRKSSRENSETRDRSRFAKPREFNARYNQ